MTAFYFGCLGGCVFVCVSDPRFIQFALGQLLRCAHEHIVNVMKVHIEGENIQVELIRFRKNFNFIHVYF